jgi:hypothetical protein
VPVLPRRIGRFLARPLHASQCDDVAALISPSAPMREALLAYGVTTPIEVLPTGLPADSYVQGDGARFRRRFSCRPIGHCCCTWVAWLMKRTSISCCACSCSCARNARMRCS